jgi:uncharacterized lipoprotein YddW (UPF0748 family)
MKNKWFAYLAITLLGIATQAQPKTEFRGVWIASVTNIDWPDTNARDSESQKASFLKLLDEHKKSGINAIIMQVRPAADALYHSTLEPWSQWFTGKQGLPPRPWYDPLEFMITETHKRGMEFHAWINPYRAVFNIKSGNQAPTHITRIHPEWFVKYGDKLYFDPASAETRKFVAHIVRDLVKRYEVDAIHFDDYFYPYKIAGKEFPDESAYRKSGTALSKADWRRSNVDSIISLISRTISKYRPGCQFGISPFGVWRNSDRDPLRGSKTKAGVTNYDDLYADILLWLKNDWIDYVAPQIYWETTSKAVPFETIVDWWNQNTYGKKCYIGIGLYRAGSNTAWRKKDELPKQIRKIRSLPNLHGMAFYSSKILERNPNGWTDSLRLQYFKQPALPPSIRK